MIIMQIREVLSPKEEKSKVSTKTMFPNIDLKVAHSKRQTADFANKKNHLPVSVYLIGDKKTCFVANQDGFVVFSELELRFSSGQHTTL